MERTKGRGNQDETGEAGYPNEGHQRPETALLCQARWEPTAEQDQEHTGEGEQDAKSKQHERQGGRAAALLAQMWLVLHSDPPFKVT
jgi:hypothetical protein